VSGMPGGSIKYKGAIDALRSILKVEGVSGLYRGLWPNLCTWTVPVALWTLTVTFAVKVAPSTATSFFTYELVKEYLVPP
jgi:solute carrier family 25 (mitochondrial phosphate transporter), member 23/24/25/41